MRTKLIVFLAVVALGAAPAFAITVNWSVDGTDNIWSAGRTVGAFNETEYPSDGDPNPNGTGGRGTYAPILNVPAGTNQWLKVSNVTGTINCCNNNPIANTGPDGSTTLFGMSQSDITVLPNGPLTPGGPSVANTLSGWLGNSMALVGVFLDNFQQQPGAQPARLDFSTGGVIGPDYLTIMPAIGQLFHVGDGLSGGVTQQRILVPATATAVVFGIVDGNDPGGQGSFQLNAGHFNDNSGGFNFTVDINAEVPEPGTISLFGLGALLLGLAAHRRRKS